MWLKIGNIRGLQSFGKAYFQGGGLSTAYYQRFMVIIPDSSIIVVTVCTCMSLFLVVQNIDFVIYYIYCIY